MAGYTLFDEGKLSFRHVDYDMDSAINDLKNSEFAKQSPGYSSAIILSVETGKDYATMLRDFVHAYDGSWEEAEQIWLESLK